MKFFLNGRMTEIPGANALQTLSEYVRGILLTGTTVVCAEGDCGACSVLVGRPNAAGTKIVYEVVDSCIIFLFQLHGAHIITIEGVGQFGNLHPVQKAMIDGFGSQCGECTPGMVMAQVAHCEHNGGGTDPESIRTDLGGNLCRCTGYVQIVEAALTHGGGTVPPIAAKFPDDQFLPEMLEMRSQTISVTEAEIPPVMSPVTLREALEMRAASPRAMVVAGATDIAVARNKGKLEMNRPILDISRIGELKTAEIVGREMRLGALATWTQVRDLSQGPLPQFAEILDRFGGPAIRNVGTVGGNLINASPTSDSLPCFMVLGSTLTLQNASGTVRTVDVNDFYAGYKTFDLRPDELLTGVTVTLPDEGELVFLSKVSRRFDLDIATVTAAIRVRLDGDIITDVAVAMGAVGPTVHRLPATEQYLLGRPLDEATITEASKLVVTEITPISDVRGSVDYRIALAESFLPEFFAVHGPVPA